MDNQSIVPNRIIELTRKEKFLIWMKRNKLTFGQLADLLDVCPSAIQYYSERETMPLRHYTKLIAFGIPADILPEPKDIVGGPRRKPKPQEAIPAAIEPAQQPAQPQ